MAASQHARNVAIVGCGIAGAAAAVLLGARGHRVCCFERADATPLVGAGLLLQPGGQWVLQQLGLLDSALALGARVDDIHTHGHRDRPILDLRYACSTRPSRRVNA
jgi:2-polyprenyl-6-methoxyphenol hydroxylase-like FAD-dependent oxidoreductase